MKSDYDGLIQQAAYNYLPDYDWRLYKAQLWQESRLDPNAESHKGALGLAQFMPMTWAAWAPKAGFKGRLRTDPEAAIYTGAAYMAWLVRQWKRERPLMDRYCLAAASYNSGLGDILRAQVIVGDLPLYAEIIRGLPQADPKGAVETTNYCRRILNVYNELVLEG